MVWVRLPVYFYKRNETFYFSRSIPADLRYRFNKRKIEVSLRTKSETIATKSAAALSDRLERYWDSLRMEAIYSRELGIKVLENTNTAQTGDYKLSTALKLYHRLKGIGKSRLFFEVSTRSIRYLEEYLDTVFGKSIAKYLPSMSKRREGGNNRRHVYLLPSLDQARKDFISVTNIPNTEWAINCEDLFQ